MADDIPVCIQLNEPGAERSEVRFDLGNLLMEEPVTVEAIIRNLLANTQVAQKAIRNLVAKIRDSRECNCDDALRDAIITQPEAIPEQTRRELGLLVDKYL